MIVTVTSLETAPGANDTVALPSALVIVPPEAVTTPEPAGAGGERPLLVFAFGSGAVASHEDGAVVVPLVCADGVVPVDAPPVPSEVVAAAPVAPSTVCVLGHDVTFVEPVLLVSLVVAAELSVAPLVGATLESIVPLVPVVPLLVDESETTVLETVPVSEVPTVVWTVAGVVEVVVVPEEIWSGAELETSALSPVELVVLAVDVSVDELVVESVDVLVSVDDGAGGDVLLADVVSVDDVSVGCVASVGSEEVEKNWYAEDGVVDCGVLVAAVGAGAGVDASAVDGKVASEPTSSSTTGAFANGSGGVFRGLLRRRRDLRVLVADDRNLVRRLDELLCRGSRGKGSALDRGKWSEDVQLRNAQQRRCNVRERQGRKRRDCCRDGCLPEYENDRADVQRDEHEQPDGRPHIFDSSET